MINSLNAGYFIFFLAQLIVAVYTKIKFAKGISGIRTHLLITLFISYGTFFYIVSKRFFHDVMYRSIGEMFSPRVQHTLIILGISLLFQYISILLTKQLFFRLMIPAVFNFFFSVFMLFSIGFGIIHLVWFLIFAGAQSSLIFITSVFEGIKSIIGDSESAKDKKEKKEILDMARDEINRLLKLGLQTFLALGASIGVSMTILFKDGEQAWSNDSFLANAFSIIIAFAIIGFGLLVWLIKPYIESYTKVRYYYNQTYDKSSILFYSGKKE